MKRSLFLFDLLVLVALCTVDGLSPSTVNSPNGSHMPVRKTQHVLSRRAALWTSLLLPSSVHAVTILNDDGEYVEVPEDDWQTTWKARLDKASSMDVDQVFMAARGAANVDPNNVSSDASRKRRAMAGCRDASTVKKTNLDQKACTAKVLNGEVAFILDVM